MASAPTAKTVPTILAGHGVTLPLRPDPDNPAVVIDANGRDVLVADPNGWRSDAEAAAIAAAIAAAVNTWEVGTLPAEEG